MDKIIIGLVGDLASGKGTICKYLKEKYGVSTYRYSTILRNLLDRLYLEQSRDNMQSLSKILRENFDQNILSKTITKDIENDPNSMVILDGIRRESDIVYLKDKPGFHLVYITADAKVRWKRIIERGENSDDKNKTFEQFLEDEKAEADRLIKELGKKAEYTITNDENLEKLHKKIEELVYKYANKN